MLGIVRGEKSAILSAWAARIVVLLAMFSANLCLIALALLFSNLAPSQVWFLSSIMFIVLGLGGLAVLIWDTRRVYAAGIREQNLTVTIVCWLVGGAAFLLNIINLMAQEANFFYLYASLVLFAAAGLLLFIQNIILLSYDPRKSSVQEKGSE